MSTRITTTRRLQVAVAAGALALLGGGAWAAQNPVADSDVAAAPAAEEAGVAPDEHEQHEEQDAHDDAGSVDHLHDAGTESTDSAPTTAPAVESAPVEDPMAAPSHADHDDGDSTVMDDDQAMDVAGGQPEDSDTAHQHTDNRDYDALWAAATPAEQAAATKLVADTKAATAKYADYDVALAAGYRPNPDGGANATHHPNHLLMRDARVLDPEAPESLMYWTARDGEKVLVGVVYKVAGSEEAPAPGGALTAWHTHVSGTKCYPAQDAACPQDTGKMLHVFFFDGVHDPFTENMVAAAGSREAFAQAMRASVS